MPRFRKKKNQLFDWSKISVYAWVGFFIIWLTILSGVFSKISSSPGLLQLVRLKTLIQERHIDVAKMEAQRVDLERQIKNIDQNPYLQEKMIREILGYARKDEIIFDFNVKDQFLSTP